jgi:hypothetical protein
MVFNHGAPKTMSAPHKGKGCKSRVNGVVWIVRITAGQSVTHFRRLPLPTMTLRGDVGIEGSSRNLAIRTWIKLWVLPPSIKTVTG